MTNLCERWPHERPARIAFAAVTTAVFVRLARRAKRRNVGPDHNAAPRLIHSIFDRARKPPRVCMRRLPSRRRSLALVNASRRGKTNRTACVAQAFNVPALRFAHHFLHLALGLDFYANHRPRLALPSWILVFQFANQRLHQLLIRAFALTIVALY
jgi:hypothetical protein